MAFRVGFRHHALQSLSAGVAIENGDMWILSTHDENGMAVSTYPTESEAQRALRAYVDPDDSQLNLDFSAFETWAPENCDVDFIIHELLSRPRTQSSASSRPANSPRYCRSRASSTSSPV